MITVYLVEDNDLVRNSLSDLIELEKDMTVIGKSSNALEALEALEAGIVPDVMITDYKMPHMSGAELTKIVSQIYRKTAVMILSMHDKILYKKEAFEAGAKAYMLKGDDIEWLAPRIRTIAAVS